VKYAETNDRLEDVEEEIEFSLRVGAYTQFRFVEVIVAV